ncbi:hypothetical protein [Loigolactobacillus backii]|uniref:Uncharacterized protein n=1 Tax=Loigolactobacillus backii TaxID=375175 RepID=A0A192H1I0_9LACO|nr:hypothetical protein [Loigolactobacillus backii]ANK62133.1 hypothetical protein AYR53_04715 [Loigolactobacillus backii]ANK68672.1 hypothetical protein AYR56_00005 [Loigolactobacillus backii]MDA5386675.1 hypothetical protein [Loigolactobacillus backii]MDA5389200.1 hypothetical protein [Loigolactobacillus backii]
MATKEDNVLDQINAQLRKLALDLRKLGGKTSHISQFLTQKQAIHEVRDIVREAQKVEQTVQTEPLTEKQLETLRYIETEFVDLDDTLINLSDDADKLKSVMAQHKALDAVQKILANSK